VKTFLGLSSITLVIALLCLLFPAHGQDFPPKAFDPERYKAISKRNPFGAILVRPSQPPAADWAKGLVLRAVSRINGHFVVHVEDTSRTNVRKSLRLVEGDNRFELAIESVKPHRNPAQVEVIVRKTRAPDVGTATLTYAPPAPVKQTRRVILPSNRNARGR